MDPYQIMDVLYNPDADTLTRLKPYPSTTTQSHNSLPNQTILTQDIPLNPTHNTSLRLFQPLHPPPDTKLPLILYLHGGGFVICTAFDTFTHDFCAQMAAQLPAVVLSLDYRLAPESRLPAAYDDAVEALLWVQNQALAQNEQNEHERVAKNENDSILNNTVDFTRCYLMGSSAGGNIAYNAALRALRLDLRPVVIQGCVLDHPFFSGVERSASEVRLEFDPDMPLELSDLMWELSLPKGSDRDHEYCNPLAEGSYKDTVGMLRECFVNTHEGDLLVDYGMKLARMLEGKGVRVVTRCQEGGCHCKEINDPAKALFEAVKSFISS